VIRCKTQALPLAGSPAHSLTFFHSPRVRSQREFPCTPRGLSENNGVQVRFLLGPAGSGKTYRCLSEIRAALQASPEGPPLLFLAPKQATFQLERQLLADDTLGGYTRLRILSFERLAEFVFERLGQPTRTLLKTTVCSFSQDNRAASW